MTVQKSHIILKYKEIENGKKSIYLDYYKDGKRIREAIHLYLFGKFTHHCPPPFTLK